MAKVVELHKSIEGIRDAGVETVLKTECVGVSKVVHIKRAAGDRLSSDDLGKWDKHMRDSLDRTLNGELDDQSRKQAVDGFKQEGLSWRTGSDTALPAFLASRVASRPAVGSVAEAGMGNLEAMMETYDARTTVALERAVSSLPDDLALNFRGMVDDGASAASARWRTLTRAGEDMQDAHEEQDVLRQEAFLADDGEPGSDRSGHVAGPLQRGLCSVVDVARGRVWDEVLRSRRRWADVRRLRELRNVTDQNRSWLWAIKNRVERCLASHDYALAVRTMLGAPVLIDPVLCGGCGRHVLDLQGKHALCCMGSATTTGHNRVRDTIAMGLAMADAGTVTEPLGFVPSAPNLRLADILTRASTVDGFLACDVEIASPEATGAGLDCVESMRVRKLEHFGERVLMELEEQMCAVHTSGPVCNSRRSTVLISLLRAAAQQAARTLDGSAAVSLVRRWELAVAVEVWRRTVVMV